MERRRERKETVRGEIFKKSREICREKGERERDKGEREREKEMVRKLKYYFLSFRSNNRIQIDTLNGTLSTGLIKWVRLMAE